MRLHLISPRSSSLKLRAERPLILCTAVSSENSPQLAAVMALHAGEGSPQPWMRMRIVGEAVGADHGGFEPEHALHVVLSHLEVAGASRLQPVARFCLRATPFGRDGGESMRPAVSGCGVDHALAMISMMPSTILAQHRRAGDVRVHVERDCCVRAGIDVRGASRRCCVSVSGPAYL